MKQLKTFKLRIDKGFSFNSQESTVKVYLPDSRLYHEFEVKPEILGKIGDSPSFSKTHNFNEWASESLKNFEDENFFYAICPFSNEGETPVVSELIIFDIFANSLTASQICKHFNEFYDQFLLLKPTLVFVDKTKKELTASNFTFFYDLMKGIYKIFYMNNQGIVFTVLSANSLSEFIMKIQVILEESDVKNWLKVLNYSLSPKVNEDFLTSNCKLSAIQKVIKVVGLENLPEKVKDFITESLLTGKVKDINSLMEQQKEKTLKLTVSELYEMFSTETVSTKSTVCNILFDL